MDNSEYGKMFRLEQDWWWFRGKQYLVSSVLSNFSDISERLNILDVGCGTGIMLKKLSKFGTIYGIDPSKKALDFCKKRNLNNVREGTIQHIPFQDCTFDVVTVLDVLSSKHVSNDIQGLKEVKRVLKPDGVVVITDSAMKCLRSRHDAAFHIRERYSKNQLRNKLEAAGFTVMRISYFNTGIFLPLYLFRKIGTLLSSSPKSDVRPLPRIINHLLTKYYLFELFFAIRLPFPLGVSLFAVGKKTR